MVEMAQNGQKSHFKRFNMRVFKRLFMLCILLYISVLRVD